MKRASAAVIIFTLLFSALPVGLLVSVGTANPAWVWFPIDPGVNISVHSPVNQKTYNACDVTADFSVDLSDWVPHWGKSIYSFSSTIKCILDGNYVWQETVVNSPQIHRFSIPLKGLPNGAHNLTIRVITYGARSLYGKGTSTPHQYSNFIRFEVAANPPEVVILSLKQQQTYNEADLPLDFTISTPVSWIGYSLDGQDNVTIAGNTTLTGLSNGAHNVTVYAKDNARNLGASETVTFTVAQTSPTNQLISAGTVASVTAIVASAAAVTAGFIFYFKKRKS